MNNSDKQELEALVEYLEARDGKHLPLMFLACTEGAEESTAMEVAQRFCFKFSRLVGMMWNDFTSLFTAYTGSAVIGVRGLTICKTAFVLKRTILTEEDKRMWQGVKMLIVDEISFIQDNQLQILDKRLKETRDSTQVFSGYSIIFAGDFRQLEPSGLSDNNPLYSRQSSNLWNDAMNAIILLDNDHRFKDDPEYGQIMMKRCGNTTYPRRGQNHSTQALLIIME